MTERWEMTGIVGEGPASTTGIDAQILNPWLSFNERHFDDTILCDEPLKLRRLHRSGCGIGDHTNEVIALWEVTNVEGSVRTYDRVRRATTLRPEA